MRNRSTERLSQLQRHTASKRKSEDLKSQDLKLASWILRGADAINFSSRAEEDRCPSSTVRQALGAQLVSLSSSS